MFGDGLQIDFNILNRTKHRVASDFEQPELLLTGLRILFYLTSTGSVWFSHEIPDTVEFREKMHWIYMYIGYIGATPHYCNNYSFSHVTESSTN